MGEGSHKPLILLGAGGHCAVLLSALTDRQVLGVSAPDKPTRALPVPFLGADEAVLEHSPESVELVLALGSVEDSTRRQQLLQTWSNRGYAFASVIHPSSQVASDAQLGNGVQVMAGAIVQVRARLDEACIVNTGAIIEHDCTLGALAHVASGAVLSGNVRVGAGALVGAGARVRQGIQIGDRAVVGTGAVVVRDVEPGALYVGVPARRTGGER